MECSSRNVNWKAEPFSILFLWQFLSYFVDCEGNYCLLYLSVPFTIQQVDCYYMLSDALFTIVIDPVVAKIYALKRHEKKSEKQRLRKGLKMMKYYFL